MGANPASDLCGSVTAVESTPLCKYHFLYISVSFLLLLTFPNSYMVDAADQDKIEASRNELHHLLDKPQLAGIPVLVLGNKRDLPNALDENGLIERM